MTIASRISALLLVPLLAVAPMQMAAQEFTETQAEAETVRVRAGEVVEFLGYADDQDTRYSWILTHNREFVQASASAVFQIRLTEPGDYLLEAAADLPGSQERRRKSITIAVEQRLPDENDDVSFQFIPSQARLQRGADVLTIQPSFRLQGPLRLDLDTARDTDGDGDAGNDNDAADTLFATEYNALRVWFASDAGGREIAVFAPESGEEKRVTIQRTNVAVQDPMPAAPDVGTGQISAEVTDSIVYFAFPIEQPPQDVLLHWDFGDGTQSLLFRPVHRYVNPGTYTVTVQARSLRDGQELTRGVHTVTIERISEAPVEPKPEAPIEPAPEEEPPTGSQGSGTLWLIARILLLGLLAVGAGMGITWLGATIIRRGGSLQKRLAEAEAKLVGNGGAAAIDVPPPPMELRRFEPEVRVEEPAPAAVQDTVAPAEPPRTPPEDTVDINAAPAWLKQGLEGHAVPAPDSDPQQELQPAPAPQMPPPQDATSNRPTQEPTAFIDAPAPAPQTVLPQEPVVQETPTPSTAPSAEPDMPEWMQEPLPADVSTPRPASEVAADGPLPPWLKDESATEAALASDPPASPDVQPMTEPDRQPAAGLEPAPAAAPVPEPLPAPAPVVAAVPEAPAIPSSTPALHAAVPATPVDPASRAAQPAVGQAMTEEERERERKRRKRQRYRENQRKRKEANPPSAPADTPANSSKPHHTVNINQPPAWLQEERAKEAAANSSAPDTPSPSPVTETPVDPAAAPTPAPSATTPDPALPAVPTEPPAMPTPLPEVQPQPPTTPPADNVAFIIRAESVEEQQKPPEGAGNAA